jgi:hypothetical protein
VSFARPGRRHRRGRALREPTAFAANGVIGPHGADETATALLTFKSGMTATGHRGVFHDAGTYGVVFGDEGKLVMPIPGSAEQAPVPGDQLHHHRDGKPPETVHIKTEMPTYAIEAELVADTQPCARASLAGDDLGRHAGEHARARCLASRAQPRSEVIETPPEVIEKPPEREYPGETDDDDDAQRRASWHVPAIARLHSELLRCLAKVEVRRERGGGGGAGSGGGVRRTRSPSSPTTPAGFWNIAKKGVEKAEQDFGIKARGAPPAQGRARRAAALSRRRDGAGFQGMAVAR